MAAYCPLWVYDGYIGRHSVMEPLGVWSTPFVCSHLWLPMAACISKNWDAKRGLLSSPDKISALLAAHRLPLRPAPLSTAFPDDNAVENDSARFQLEEQRLFSEYEIEGSI